MLKITGLRAGYGNVEVLRGVDLELNSGEVAIVRGVSGSGKSTLVKAIAGVIGLEGGWARGSIKVDGVELSDKAPRERSRYISVVFQDPTIHFTYPRISDDLESYAHEVGSTVNEILRIAGLSGGILSKLVTELSMGQLQRLAIAKALARGVRVIVLDEPLAHLDAESSIRLAKIITSNSLTALVLEHRCVPGGLKYRQFRLADGVLKEGEPEGCSGEVKVVDVDDGQDEGWQNAEPWLRLSNVWFRYDYGDEYVLRGINLSLRSPIAVVIGGNGVGKSTLLRVTSGMLRPTKGSVDGLKTLYIPQDIDSLMAMEATVKGLYAKLAKARGIRPNMDLLRGSLKAVGLDIDLGRDPLELSEGQKRMLAMALALSLGFKAVALDEPTAGLDEEHARRLVEVMVNSGLRFIVATQDFGLVEMLNKYEAYIFNGPLGLVRRVRLNGQ